MAKKKTKKRICIAFAVIAVFMIAMIAAHHYQLYYAPVPTACITNVDSATIAQILCQNEVELAEMTIVDPVYNNTPFKRRVNNALVQNESKMVAEYAIGLGFGAKKFCRDIVVLDTSQPGQVVLSLRCQYRDDESAWSSSVFGYCIRSLNRLYHRNYGREYRIMVNTVQQLQAEHQAEIKWLGRWRPERCKSNWPEGNSGLYYWGEIKG